jgi:hypothetical protein
MKMTARLAILILALLAARLGFAQAGVAPVPQIKSTFVHLGGGVPAVLYEPATPGPKSAIAVYAMHAEVDYLQFRACTELSLRGYRVLCANNSASKSGTNNDLSIDRALLDASLGVAYLRTVAGVRKIVLLGHSGGAALMSAYQSIAEGGVKVCQGSEKILKCPDTLAGLPAADGLILMDANYGMSTMSLFSLDPAVIDESSGQLLNPALNLFNPDNGFKPGATHYSAQFRDAFLSAVGQRENRLIKSALDRLEKINSGKGQYSDDEPFVVPGASYLGFNNKLFAEDTSLLAHTRHAWPLLHKDGRITTQVIYSVRRPENDTSATSSLERGALKTTVRKFLSTYAIRTTDEFAYDEDSIRGVDWLSSYTTPVGNVQSVSVPLLTLGMTGHWEYLSSELIYEHAQSTDKSVAFIEGATHGFTPCTKCEKSPGEFGDTVKTTFDYIDAWLSKPGRF